MIRIATPDDRSQFMELWAEFMAEQRKLGSHTHDNIHNLSIMRGYFDSYTRGSLFGFTLLWFPEESNEPAGVLMAGEDWGNNHWETDAGKTAILWGVYVRPTHRGQKVAHQLQLEALPLGIKTGFKSMETYVMPTNQPGMALSLDTKPIQVRYLANLRETVSGLEKEI